MRLLVRSKKYGDHHALIDADDFPLVKSYDWYLMICRKVIKYAVAKSQAGPVVILHRIILNAPRGLFVDHKNGNGLDCRRANIRVATRSQNGANRIKRASTSSSKFLGVWMDKRSGLWEACLRLKGKRYRKGGFRTESGAAAEYNRLASLHHGEFAKPNAIHKNTGPN